MRAPHVLSAGLSPDPFYDATARLPEAPGSALFGDPANAGRACWLYAPGDLEGYLMALMRQDAFAVCTGIFHPGDFHRPHGLVAFERSLEIATVPTSFPLTLWHSGELRVDVNNTLVHRAPSTATPQATHLDLAAFLRPGPNQLKLTVTRLDEPPCVLVESTSLLSDATWTASTNLTEKIPTATYPAAGTQRFPHQETLPTARITRPLSADGVAHFGCVLLGRPRLPAEDFVGLGESLVETRCAPAHAEQRPLFDDERPRAFQFVATRGSTRASGQLSADISLHPVRYAGAFACSDERLTRIWQHAAASLRVSLRELTVDGLKRDRLPWAGDAYISALGNAAVFGEHRCIQRTLAALAPEDPARCPTNGIIDYDAHWIMAVAEQFRFSGDTHAARLLWPNIERILAALRAREDTDGFLRHEGTWLFIDWISFDHAQRSVALQALYVGALHAAAELAAALALTSRSQELSTRAAHLAEATRREHWDPRLAAHVNPTSSPLPPLPAGHHARFLSELFGVIPPGAALAATEGPPAATAYMRYFEAAAHARAGRRDTMLAGVRDYWGGMLDAGASTFWEGFDPAEQGDARDAFYGRPFGKSLCHAWACGPLPLLSFELAGLRPSAGWSEVRCTPTPIPLDWACATIPTPHGDLRWELENTTLRIEAPAGVNVVAERATRDGATLVVGL